MRIGIITVTYNNYEILIRCLKSVYKTMRSDCHLVIIDNASQDQTLGLYGANLQRTTIIRNSQNKWWGGGINQGIRLLQGDCDFIFFINDDIEVDTGWIERHVEALESNRAIGAVGPLNSHPRDWQNYDRIRGQFVDLELPPLDDMKRTDLVGMNTAVRSIYKGNSICYVTGMLAFFCVAFRNDVISEIGYLDEEFIMNGDDDDYCRRLEAKGFSLALLLNTYVIHNAGSSINKLDPEFRIKTHEANIKRLQSKYPLHYGKHE